MKKSRHYLTTLGPVVAFIPWVIALFLPVINFDYGKEIYTGFSTFINGLVAALTIFNVYGLAWHANTMAFLTAAVMMYERQTTRFSRITALLAPILGSIVYFLPLRDISYNDISSYSQGVWLPAMYLWQLSLVLIFLLTVWVFAREKRAVATGLGQKTNALQLARQYFRK